MTPISISPSQTRRRNGHKMQSVRNLNASESIPKMSIEAITQGYQKLRSRSNLMVSKEERTWKSSRYALLAY